MIKKMLKNLLTPQQAVRYSSQIFLSSTTSIFSLSKFVASCGVLNSNFEIKKFLAVFLALAVLGIVVGQETSGELCDGQQYLLIEMQYNNGNFSVLNKTLEEGCAPLMLSEKRYEYVLSDAGEKVYSSGFNPSEIFVDNEEGSDMLLLEDTRFFITAPSLINAENIEIYEAEKKVFEDKIYDVGATSCREK